MQNMCGGLRVARLGRLGGSPTRVVGGTPGLLGMSERRGPAVAEGIQGVSAGRKKGPRRHCSACTTCEGRTPPLEELLPLMLQNLPWNTARRCQR